MNGHGDRQENGGVKRFRFVSPQNGSAMLSKPLSPDPSASSNSGLDLENVWSIQKNVSVDLKPVANNSLLSSTRKETPPRNTFFSRHYQTSCNSTPLVDTSSVHEKNISSGRMKKSWHSFSPQHKSLDKSKDEDNSFVSISLTQDPVLNNQQRSGKRRVYLFRTF